MVRTLFYSVSEMICSLFIENAEKCFDTNLLMDDVFIGGLMLLLLESFWRSYMVTLILCLALAL